MKRLTTLFRFYFVVLSILSLTLSCDESNPLDFDTSGLKNIHIGIYSDNGTTNVEEVESMLSQMNCNYSRINKETIIDNELENYDLILFPGGDMWEYKNDLYPTGVSNLKSFVQHGGGYIGICGGSYFAASTIVWRGWADEPRTYLTISGLGFLKGYADGPIEDFAPTYQVENCDVTINKNHPVTNDVSDRLDYLYSFGPKFIISDSSDVTVLGRTSTGNNNVVLAIEYYEGKVFLTALHPEFDDNRTSWKMIRNAIMWCIGSEL